MNNNETPVEMLFEKAENYGKTTVALFKLKAINKSAEVVSSLASCIIISIVVSVFLLCLNIGFALWISEKTGKLYIGFFIVAGVYLLIAMFTYIFRNKWIKNPVSNHFIKQLLE